MQEPTYRETSEPIRAAALNEGYSPFQAALIAARLGPDIIARAGSVRRAIEPSLGVLDSPTSLPDIERAVTRLVRAIDRGETIALATDHDADGVTSHVVLYRGLIEYCGMPAERVQSFTTDKLSEGYGISDAFVDRVLAHHPRPHLLVTADQGSCDEPRIRRLREAGIETIVTDHHGMLPEGPPASAIATVTPARTDSAFPDAAIAGCHVAWLLVAALRTHLQKLGRAPSQASIADLLDYVGLGTTCDCVSLARSVNNRAIIRAALRRMNERPRPAWTALMEAARRDAGEPIDESTLGWVFGPRANASGRVASAMPGVHLLLADTLEEARPYAQALEENNTRRKALQAGMLEQASELARTLADAGDPVPLVWLPDGHVGIQGIVASHVMREVGRPIICLAPPPQAPDLLSGSMRSPPGIHAKALLDEVARSRPGVLRKHGGHAGAAGLTIASADYDALREALTEAFARLGFTHGDGGIEPVDADPPEIGTLRVLEEIEALGPYGMDFPAPRFKGVFTIARVEPMGDGSHLRMLLYPPGQGAASLRAVWFGAGKRLHTLPRQGVVIYRLARNTWKGRTSVDLQIEEVL